MVRRETKNRIIALGISLSLIALIIFVLTPPAMAVELNAGTPNDTSLNKGQTVTFNNVRLTIRNLERIPVVFLNYTIHDTNNNNAVVAWIEFNITGHEQDDYPDNTMTSQATSDVSNLPYGTGGSYYGYDERAGENVTGYGYGYGYAGSGLLDLEILYKITYKTQNTGTFKGRLSVNCSNYTYLSNYSSTVRVRTTSTGDGDGDDGTGTGDGDEEEEGTTTSDDNIDDINEDYGLNLDEPFYGNDTDGDGTVDSFTDPNGVLTKVKDTTIDGNPAFLISTDGDEIPEFFWDPVDDTITPITHAPPTSTTSETDHEAETITVTVSVTKESGWIYIDVDDEYPGYTLTVKNSEGEEISSDKIWREGGKVYVLDDPTENYEFIYNFLLLPPTFTPISGTTFNISKPTITVTYTEKVTIQQATLNDLTIVFYTEDHKVFTYTPETDLEEGTYTLSITVEDAQGNTLTSAQTFTIDLPGVEEPEEKPEEGFPWPIVIVVVIIIIAIIIFLLFKTGYLYIEEVEEEEEEPEPVKEIKKEKEVTKKKPEKKETKTKKSKKK